ncbi:MAG: Beta-barrel assembly-enhancing protease [Chloroflexi bacterium]|nr:Beta-barrel assembly-enhancing protease [Chloroflexota bacterium]
MDKWKKILFRLMIILVLGLLLNFAPRSYRVGQDFRGLQAALAEEDFQTVAEHLADIVEHLPWRVELWESAGQYAFLAEDYTLARYAFEQAEEGEALSGAGRLALGDVYRALGEDALAEEAWAGVDGSPEALRRLALLHREMGDIPATIADWQALLALGQVPDERDVHYQLGLLLAAHAPWESIPHLEAAADAYPAAQALEQALANVAADAEAAYFHVVAGQALASSNEWSLAKYAFQQSVNAREDYAEAWAYLGEALQHAQKNDQEALSALQKALTLDPDSFAANMFSGLYWQRQGKPEEALAYFESAAALMPDSPEVYVELGQTLAALSQLSDAEVAYQEAISRAPQEAEYYRLLAQFCVQYHHKVRDLGLPAARQGMRLAEEDPASPDALGVVLLELEDEYNAERLFLEAVDLDPQYAPAHLHLGMVYLYQEKNIRAHYHLNQALDFATNPSLIEHAQHLLGYFEE